jgi:hypothetical protein
MNSSNRMVSPVSKHAILESNESRNMSDKSSNEELKVTGVYAVENNLSGESQACLFQSTNPQEEDLVVVLTRLESEALREGLQFTSFREAPSKMSKKDFLSRYQEFEFSIMWAREIRKIRQSLTWVQHPFCVAPNTIPFEPEGITLLVSKLKKQVKYSKWIRRLGLFILFGMVFVFYMNLY